MPIALSGVGFTWPDGEVLFENLTETLVDHKYALFAANGMGKSTLIQLLTGKRSQTAGLITSQGLILDLAQFEEPQKESIYEYLCATPMQAPLGYQLLGGLELDQQCGELSGGQWIRVRLARLVFSEADFLILDEPTNNLDFEGRAALFLFLQNYSKGLLLVSHDREALSHCDEVIELHKKGLISYSGRFDDFWVERSRLAAKAEDQLRTVKKDEERIKVEALERVEKQKKRTKHIEMKAHNLGLPKIIRGARKRAAQRTLGKVESFGAEAVDEIANLREKLAEELRFDEGMFIKVPNPDIPQQKTILRIEDFNISYEPGSWLLSTDLNLELKGPSRLHLLGKNGSGKSSLLQAIRGESLKTMFRGHIKTMTQQTSYVDQEYSMLKKGHPSLYELCRPNFIGTEGDLRSQLAAFQFRGDKVFQSLESLSGGEKLRAALAAGLLQEAPPELIILDEPTNNLDVFNVDFLIRFLRWYTGALIIVSHDTAFTDQIQFDRKLELS